MISKFYRHIFRFNAHVTLGLDLVILIITSVAIVTAFPIKEGLGLASTSALLNLVPLAISFSVADRCDRILDELQRQDSKLTMSLERCILAAKSVTYWTAISIILKLIYLGLTISAIYIYTALKVDLYDIFAIVFTGYLISIFGGVLAYTENRFKVPLSRI